MNPQIPDDSQLLQALTHVLSPDPSLRIPATSLLEQSSLEHLPLYLAFLLRVMSDELLDGALRMTASIQLKNAVAFNARETQRKLRLEAQWRGFSPSVRDSVKDTTLKILLQSPNREVGLIVALVVANLARMEMPVQNWPTLVPVLCEQKNEAAVTAIGYICEECEHDARFRATMHAESQRILGCIFTALGENNEPLQVAALKTLGHASILLSDVMTNEQSVESILQELAQTLDPTRSSVRCRNQAMDVLARFGSLYADELLRFSPRVTSLTLASLDDAEVAVQAWNVWHDILAASVSWATVALEPLWPRIQTALLQQEEFQGEEDWNVSLAASAVLTKLCLAAGASLKDPLLNFTQQQLVSQATWRNQEAACAAFGALLCGAATSIAPESLVSLSQWISLATGNDIHLNVRDSALWVIGLIAGELTEELLVRPDELTAIFTCVHQLLQQTASDALSARLQRRACNILYEFCDSLVEIRENSDKPDLVPETNALSPFLGVMLTQILTTVQKSDNPELLTSSQETVNVLIEGSATDALQILCELLGHVTTEIQRALTSEDRAPLLPSLVGTLTTLAHRLGNRVLPSLQLILNTLTSAIAHSSDTDLYREVFICIGALATAIESDLEPFLSSLVQPACIQGLQLGSELPEVCSVALNATSDVIIALSTTLLPSVGSPSPGPMVEQQRPLGAFCTEALPLMLSLIKESRLIAPALVAIGDAALHLGPSMFIPQLPVTVNAVRSSFASSVSFLEDNEMQQLLRGMAAFFTGFVQGFKGNLAPLIESGLIELLLQWVPFACETAVSSGQWDLFRLSLSIVGDLFDSAGAEPNPDVCQQVNNQFLASAKLIEIVSSAETLVQTHDPEHLGDVQWVYQRHSLFVQRC